ncbi:uncharacterized protein LOC133912707 isoform X1 [Phragmites australis]|uniref:uncharacterized protein LOC133912707 isoform X1 n=2 Tax=Phragmites australis TaxID=29695 RepID=UPI002D797311|nr:uncharacterized protein LOC133912707 isoform X1 [Phragmites australis]
MFFGRSAGTCCAFCFGGGEWISFLLFFIWILGYVFSAPHVVPLTSSSMVWTDRTRPRSPESKPAGGLRRQHLSLLVMRPSVGFSVSSSATSTPPHLQGATAPDASDEYCESASCLREVPRNSVRGLLVCASQGSSLCTILVILQCKCFFCWRNWFGFGVRNASNHSCTLFWDNHQRSNEITKLSHHQRILCSIGMLLYLCSFDSSLLPFLMLFGFVQRLF